MRPELERLKTEDITDEELARFKTRAKADLIRSLDSQRRASPSNLANYQTLFGDWRELFRYVDRLDTVTKADVRKRGDGDLRRRQPHGGEDRDAPPRPPRPSGASTMIRLHRFAIRCPRSPRCAVARGRPAGRGAGRQAVRDHLSAAAGLPGAEADALRAAERHGGDGHRGSRAAARQRHRAHPHRLAARAGREGRARRRWSARCCAAAARRRASPTRSTSSSRRGPRRSRRGMSADSGVGVDERAQGRRAGGHGGVRRRAAQAGVRCRSAEDRDDRRHTPASRARTTTRRASPSASSPR